MSELETCMKKERFQSYTVDIRYSTSLITREKIIKTIMRYHFTHTRIAI